MTKATYIQYSNSRKNVMQITKKLIENEFSIMDTIRLENNIFERIGTNNAVTAIGLDAHNNVWVQSTNYGGATNTSTFVVLRGTSNKAYELMKGTTVPFNHIAKKLSFIITF